jgi:rod shape determining protein RodA
LIPAGLASRSQQTINQPDWMVLLIYLALVVFGWMNIYSTQSDSAAIFDLTKKHGAQLIWIAIAFVSATAIMAISYKFYSVFANYVYGSVILLLMVVLVVGVEVNNSKSWLAFGTVRFQPSELAKLASSLALARFMSEYNFRLNSLRSWLVILGLILFPVMLILLQRDWGSALVFSAFILMLYREGMSGWILTGAVFLVLLFIATLMIDTIWIMIALSVFSLAVFIFRNDDYVMVLPVAVLALVLFSGLATYNVAVKSEADYDKLLCIATLGAFALWLLYAFFKRLKMHLPIIAFLFFSSVTVYSVEYIYGQVLKPHHRDRIEVLLGVKEDIKNTGYNVYQAKVAIGSGGFGGKGYLQGTQTKLNFVPEQSTDFIFCTVGEEWGFVGSLILILLFAVLLIRIIMLSERQKDKFTKIYGYCTASIIFFHFAVNIAMTIGLAPVIGIPLPFISAGGSSLWCFTMLLFIFLKLNSIKYGHE